MENVLKISKRDNVTRARRQHTSFSFLSFSMFYSSYIYVCVWGGREAGVVDEMYCEPRENSRGLSRSRETSPSD